MLHQHGHHHIDEHELGGEHEGDKVHRRNKLKARIAGIVHIGAVVRWALPQCVLEAEGGEKCGWLEEEEETQQISSQGYHS